MTHVVTDECIKCKHTDCVEYCPVNCFYEGELMLVINPDECVDCGNCVDECPVGAIKTESADLIDWIERAKTYSAIWPNITIAKLPLPTAATYATEKNKYEKYMLNNIKP